MYAPDASILHGKIVPKRKAVTPRPEKAQPAALTPAPKPRPSLIGRLFHRKEPTVYQRCLAVHIQNAGQHGGMH